MDRAVDRDELERYVRKDVFESRMERLEAIVDANIARHEAIAARIEGRFDTLMARLDTLQNKFAWNLAWIAIVISLVLAIVQRIWK